MSVCQYIVVAICLGIGSIGLQAQSISKGEPLPVEIQQWLEETENLSSRNLDSAFLIADQALQAAYLLDHKTATATCLDKIATLAVKGGQYNIALDYYAQGLQLWDSLGNKVAAAKLLSDRGYAYLLQQNYPKAIADYTQAITLREELGDTEGLITSYFDFVDFYTNRFDFPLAANYLTICDSLLQLYPSTKQQAHFFARKGKLAFYQRNYQDAIDQYNQSIHLFNTIGLSDNQGPILIMLGVVYVYMGDDWVNKNPTKAQNFYYRALEIHSDNLKTHIDHGKRQGIIDVSLNLGGVYRRLGRYQQGLDTLRKAAQLAEAINSPGDVAIAYRIMSDIFQKMKNVDSVMHYRKLYEAQNDKSVREKSEKAIRFAEVYYQTQKKEKENAQMRQEAQIQGLRFRTTVISSILLGILLIGFIYYFYNRTRTQRKLMEQQTKINGQIVIDLIKEQTIENLNSRLEGQEQERERIARDLHDRLGGTLAAVKWSLEGLERKLPESATKSYTKTQTLLDRAWNETRRLSHDMMALPLQNLGLEASLHELCEMLNTNGELTITYSNQLNEPLKLSEKVERHLYRIIQELLQNVIKHAKASQVSLTLSKEETTLKVALEDNGKGFAHAPNEIKGMGLKNVDARTQQLGGTFSINSQVGKGTKVKLEVPV